jgi:hypothetical protein
MAEEVGEDKKLVPPYQRPAKIVAWVHKNHEWLQGDLPPWAEACRRCVADIRIPTSPKVFQDIVEAFGLGWVPKLARGTTAVLSARARLNAVEETLKLLQLGVDAATQASATAAEKLKALDELKVEVASLRAAMSRLFTDLGAQPPPATGMVGSASVVRVADTGKKSEVHKRP